MRTAISHHHPHDATKSLDLASGESLMLQARTGTSVITTGGTLVVTHAPIWLGEQVFRARVPLEAGQAQQFDEGGWITLTGGLHGGTLRVVQPPMRPAWSARVWRLWRGLAALSRLART